LSVITIDETEKWDNIVKSFKAYDVNYLSGYAKAFQLHGDGEPLLFFYDDGNTRAMNVVMKRDIALAKPFKSKLPLNEWFDISTPYGYGNFWVEGEGWEAVNAAYNSYCAEKGFISEFVRFHLFSDCQQHFSGLIETHTHNIVRDLELSIDEILINFDRKVRRSLKTANQAALQVEIDTTGERLDEFLEIYYGTMDRSCARENYYFSKEFFKVINKMVGQFVYIHILYEEKVISTELVLYGVENCYSFLGGTNGDYFDLRPNDFLKVEMFKWAKDKGLKKVILGGGCGEDDNIFKYKKRFSPNGVYDFYIGKKIFDEEKYKELVEIRKNEDCFAESTTFFPVYRG